MVYGEFPEVLDDLKQQFLIVLLEIELSEPTQIGCDMLVDVLALPHPIGPQLLPLSLQLVDEVVEGQPDFAPFVQNGVLGYGLVYFC